MAISDHKITDFQGKDVASLPDKLTGSAAENKAVFDRLVKEVVTVAYNGLVEELNRLHADNLVWAPQPLSFREQGGRLQYSLNGRDYTGAVPGMSQCLEVYLFSDRWSYGLDPSYELTDSRIRADSQLEILPGDSISSGEMVELDRALPVIRARGEGKACIRCMGSMPSVNIPVKIIIRGDL